VLLAVLEGAERLRLRDAERVSAEVGAVTGRLLVMGRGQDASALPPEAVAARDGNGSVEDDLPVCPPAPTLRLGSAAAAQARVNIV
jgi:hypothetical protein